MAELTYNQMNKLSHCMTPQVQTPHNFGLVCTLLQTMMGVGWACWSLLTMISLTTVILGLRRKWMRDDGSMKTPVNELWDAGWNGSWEKQQQGRDYA